MLVISSTVCWSVVGVGCFGLELFILGILGGTGRTNTKNSSGRPIPNKKQPVLEIEKTDLFVEDEASSAVTFEK